MLTTIREKILAFFIATGLVLCGLALVLWLAVENAHTLQDAQRTRYESYRLADELRQSSDDLTRLVRTYIVTGDIRFKLADLKRDKILLDDVKRIAEDIVSEHQHTIDSLIERWLGSTREYANV